MLGFQALCAGSAIAGGSEIAGFATHAPAPGIGVGGDAWGKTYRRKLYPRVPTGAAELERWMRLKRRLQMYQDQYEMASYEEQLVMDMKIQAIEDELQSLEWEV